MSEQTRQPQIITPTPNHLVGVDVASEKCTVAILKADKTPVLKPVDFDNRLNGYEWLVAQLGQLSVAPATIVIGIGSYCPLLENLYLYLESFGYRHIVLHPAQTHHRTNARGLRAKTDRLDSLTIARNILSDDVRPAYVAQ